MAQAGDSSTIQEKHAPIVELALLRLLAPFTTSSAVIRTNLASIKSVLQDHSENPFYIYSQIEDPSLIYLIGSWPTLADHDKFLASDANKDLLSQVKDQIVVVWMFHLDIPLSVIPLEAPVMSIGRFVMKKLDVQGYVTCFANVQRYLAEHVTPMRWAQGRRIDVPMKEGGGGQNAGLADQAEYVLFCGWGSMERHLVFAGTGAGREFGALSDWLVETDVKHAKPLDL